MKYYAEIEREFNEAAKAAKAEPSKLVNKINAMHDEIKELSSENEKLKAKLANDAVGDVDSRIKEIKGVKVLAMAVPDVDMNMMAQMYSGVLMFRYVFHFLPFNGGMSLVRRLHILGAYWGFLLMSLHLGLHWNMILGMFRKATGIKSKAKSRSMIALVIGLTIAGYGLWAFIGRDFPTYLFLKSEFVFWDYNEPKILFYIDYLALMGLCIFIAHYSTKFIRKFNKK